jgi:ornithine cyclodeaminase/alanine dehydrogenase-like protein (mu-crystallin family)
MKILTANDVKKALPMKDCIEAMKRGYIALVNGNAEVPLRTRLPIPSQNAISIFMPAYVQDKTGNALAVKIVSLYPNNPDLGLPFIQAVVVVLDPDTGKPVALLEGSSLTAIRTGAASGAATDLLSREDSRVAAIFGAGVQGRTQLEAICTVRDIEQVWLYDTDSARVKSFIEEMSGRSPIPTDLRIAESPFQAVSNADVVCCATTATSPVFLDTSLKAGVHINAIGSYTPEMQEIPSATIARALVVVDSRSATLAETGDLLRPIHEGLIDQDHIYAELGEIAQGSKLGRANAGQITYFKSVGLAVQDAMAAQLALQNSEKMCLGQTVPF